MSRPCHRGLVDPLAHAKIECHAAQDAGLLSAEGLFADQEVDGLMDADLTAAQASSRGSNEEPGANSWRSHALIGRLPKHWSTGLSFGSWQSGMEANAQFSLKIMSGPRGSRKRQASFRSLHVTLPVPFFLFLLEGGGKINGSFLKAGLIDEISVLIYPGVDGLAGVPSIFEYVGKPDEKPAEGQSLRHIGTETLDGGMVWLRYAVEKS